MLSEWPSAVAVAYRHIQGHVTPLQHCHTSSLGEVRAQHPAG